jgi:hypothetical protein
MPWSTPLEDPIVLPRGRQLVTLQVGDHGLVALKLLARHLAKHHPIAMEILEWSFSVGVGFFLLTATLIANA